MGHTINGRWGKSSSLTKLGLEPKLCDGEECDIGACGGGSAGGARARR
uniref:Uncharacterized protein n=1 Tax=Arundo donax TaxID=35708 RepID=A0A0A9ADY6_ARUDO